MEQGAYLCNTEYFSSTLMRAAYHCIRRENIYIKDLTQTEVFQMRAALRMRERREIHSASITILLEIYSCWKHNIYGLGQRLL